MKTDFCISVQVNLGVTPELSKLMGAFLSRRSTTTPTTEETPDAESETTTAALQPPKRDRKKKEVAASKSDSEAEPEQPSKEVEADVEASGDDSQTTETEQAEQTEDKAPKAPEATAAVATKPLNAEDVRAAMHKTRQRIEGEDYKEHTDSELYKKYHRVLTGEFKKISATLGSERPSSLDPEKISIFIAECDELEILEDGTIGTKPPF